MCVVEALFSNFFALSTSLTNNWADCLQTEWVSAPSLRANWFVERFWHKMAAMNHPGGPGRSLTDGVPAHSSSSPHSCSPSDPSYLLRTTFTLLIMTQSALWIMPVVNVTSHHRPAGGNVLLHLITYWFWPAKCHGESLMEGDLFSGLQIHESEAFLFSFHIFNTLKTARVCIHVIACHFHCSAVFSTLLQRLAM